jgi:hypothetical protein
MEHVTNEEVELMAAARALLLHGEGYSGQALALERENVRARLAAMGHPLESETPTQTREHEPDYLSRNSWRAW